MTKMIMVYIIYSQDFQIVLEESDLGLPMEPAAY